MITGFVDEFEEPIIKIDIVLGDQSKNLPAVIDTGFPRIIHSIFKGCGITIIVGNVRINV